MAWFGLAKIALQAGSKIYANRQKTKMAMSDAQLMHAERMARGEESYQGKLLEARQNDYKDEIVLAILTLPIIVLAWSVWTEDPAAMQKIDQGTKVKVAGTRRMLASKNKTATWF